MIERELEEVSQATTRSNNTMILHLLARLTMVGDFA